MAVVVVLVETTHSDIDEAVRSVTNAMERAGYDCDGFTVDPLKGLEFHSIEAVLNVSEPEVNSGNLY